MSVYQYDAHAWSEIWLEGIGWQRVDPTAAVDPERVESGWSTELLSQQSSLSSDFLGLYQFRQMAWLNAIRLQFDALDYQWARWVLGYSSEQQYNLLKSTQHDYKSQFSQQGDELIDITMLLSNKLNLFWLILRSTKRNLKKLIKLFKYSISSSLKSKGLSIAD